jgi:hypothetical protein
MVAHGPVVEFVIVILVILIVVGIVIYNHHLAEQRRRALAKWAAARQLRFSPDSDYSLDSRFADFSCLLQGSDRYAYNVCDGARNGRRVCAFDYHYETYSTDSKGRRRTHHHYFSAVVLETGLPLKPLFVRTESFFDKVTEFFGYDDIDFESAEFSREFYVKSPDKRWAFDVIHPATMEFLLASPRFSIEMAGGRVIAYRERTFEVADFDAALGVLEGILDRLPEYLLREWKGGP